LVGPLHQGIKAVADEIGRRLVAGIEDEDAVLQQLGVGEPLAVRLAFAVDEPGQHVDCRIARVLSPVGHQVIEIGQELDHGLVAARLLVGRQHRLERPQDGQRPAAQRPAVGLRHRQQIADDLNRDGGGEIVDQIGGPLLGNGVEEAVDERTDRAPCAPWRAGSGLRR
jgi:hypothetical protein